MSSNKETELRKKFGILMWSELGHVERQVTQVLSHDLKTREFLCGQIAPANYLLAHGRISGSEYADTVIGLACDFANPDDLAMPLEPFIDKAEEVLKVTGQLVMYAVNDLRVDDVLVRLAKLRIAILIQVAERESDLSHMVCICFKDGGFWVDGNEETLSSIVNRFYSNSRNVLIGEMTNKEVAPWKR